MNGRRWLVAFGVNVPRSHTHTVVTRSERAGRVLTKLQQLPDGAQVPVGAGHVQRGALLLNHLIHVCTMLDQGLQALWVT